MAALPEPQRGILMFVGLAGIAAVRRRPRRAAVDIQRRDAVGQGTTG
jgi:hypothetical protein